VHALLRCPIPALFLALTLIGLHLVQLGHALLVSHHVCEHGDVAHTGPGSVGHPGASDAQADDDPPSSQHAPDGAPAEADHEHCAPFAVEHAALDAPRLVIAPLLLDAYVLPWSLRPQERRAAAVLAFAPKNSPPTSSPSVRRS
jgi:hypothetical protein